MSGRPRSSRRLLRTALAARLSLLLVLPVAVSAPAARALEWPDVAERVEQDLQSPNASTRRQAAHRLPALGPGRGRSLALLSLGDLDDDVRLAAADAAVRLKASGATDQVVSWLNAPDVRLRRKACEVARAMPSPHAVAPLARSLGDPEAEVRAAAAAALGRQASPDAVPPLLGRLDDPAPQVRMQIVAALARLGDRRAVVPLVGKVQDSSPEVRQAVARALGDLGDARASSALVLSLRDQSSDVRREALGALGRVGAADAVDAIAPFTSDRTSSLRLAALSALGRIASVDALRVLVHALGTGDDAGGALEATPVREALIAAGPPAVEPLRALLASSTSPVRATSAAWVLGVLRATPEAPAIVAAMRRGALPTAAALRSLVGAGTANEVPVVLEFLADPRPAVRDEAIEAAMALLDPRHPDGRAVEPLAAALRDGRPSAAQRARLTTLLGRTGAARAAPLLVDLSRTRDTHLRVAALDALGTIGPAGGADADEALLDGLAAADPEVRLHAAVALGESGGGRARDVLLARLESGTEVDRPAVLTALGGLLARSPTDLAIAQIETALALSAGAERDALLDALGRAPSAAGVRALGAAAKRAEPDDRREVASLLAAHPGDPTALALARGLVGDRDPSVGAQAAWTLGTLGDASDGKTLAALAESSDQAAASNAAAALGRIAARLRAPQLAARLLCPLAVEPRSPARANALAGLALAGARCGDGTAERELLDEDPSDDVRAAAASMLARSPTEDDLRALERCARTDPSGAVAARCRARPPRPGGTGALLVYVGADGSAVSRPDAGYALLMSDGLIRRGVTDRRGAVVDPAAPEGEVTLRPPTPVP